MFFFGWGQKTKEYAPNDNTRIVVTYAYAHLMFLITIAWSPTYYLATWTEQGWATRIVTREEATAVNGGVVPDIHPWWKFSFLVAASLLVTGTFLAVVLS